MARQKTKSTISGVVLVNTLNLHHTTLKDRGVTDQSTQGQPLCYYFTEVMEKCGDLIYYNLKSKYCNDDGIDNGDLKKEKLREEIRKLKLDNDVNEGVLVPASDVSMTYTKGIRSICDVLDALPSRVKMENPNITPATLDSINRCLIEVRNKSAHALDE